MINLGKKKGKGKRKHSNRGAILKVVRTAKKERKKTKRKAEIEKLKEQFEGE